MSLEKYFSELQTCKNPTVIQFCVLKTLSLLEKIYLKAVTKRNEKTKEIKISVPVISVGNITVGGTGKTPCIIQLAEYLHKKGKKTAILSRGYRGAMEKKGAIVSDGKNIFLDEKDAGDEPYMIAHKLPKVSVYVGKDRLKSAKKAIKNGNEILLLDDGFQYRKIARDKNIVLIDCTNPFGYEHLLPRGLLREPLEGLKRANLVILTKSNQASKNKIEEIKKRILKINQNVKILESFHKPESFVNVKNAQKYSFESMHMKKALLLSGIGNPKAFEKTAKEAGLIICETIIKKDHHTFVYDDMIDAVNRAKTCNADIIAVTEKDAVKIKNILLKNNIDFPIYALCIEMKYAENGKEILQKYLEDLF